MTFHFIPNFNGVFSNLQIKLSKRGFSLYLKTLENVKVHR